VSVVCGQIEVSATGRLLVQRSPSECGVSECDLQTSTMRRPMPNRALEPSKGVMICLSNCTSLAPKVVIAIKHKPNEILRTTAMSVFYSLQKNLTKFPKICYIISGPKFSGTAGSQARIFAILLVYYLL
jgi:hypothetical protein